MKVLLSLVLLLCLQWQCFAATTDGDLNANVVYYEPHLPNAYATEIHPYAYAYRLPDPHYTPHQTPVSVAHDFNQFIELQDHVQAGSERAKALTVTPELLEPQTVSLLEDHEEVLPLEAAASSIAAAAKYLTDNNGDHNPASESPIVLDPHPSPFLNDVHTSGVFHSGYRRAVYGLRRRRMPFTFNALTMTINPFRRPNSFMNTPQDIVFPRLRYLEAMNPSMTDYGKLGGPNKMPYGGYSSFSALRHQEPNPGSIGGMGNFEPFKMNVPQPDWLQNYGGVQDPMRSRSSTWPLPNPLRDGPSPYIPGMESFHDFYAGGKGGGDAAGGDAGGDAAGGDAAGGDAAGGGQQG